MAELSLAPMLKVTTPHFRRFFRKIYPDVVLFTEMIVSSTVVHIDSEKLRHILGSPESNTVVQIGGSDPTEIADAIKILVVEGWSSFNLNCGCPSDRVQCGRFGAILMKDKELVARIINTVHQSTGVVLSIKTRTGVDNDDSYEFFREFVSYLVDNTSCRKFYIHARKCWLKGLSPSQNRCIPPLNYDYVYRIKTEYPDVFVSLNGGIKEDGMDKLKNLDGLMVGRAAVDDPRVFSGYGCAMVDVKSAVREYFDSVDDVRISLSKVIIPLMGLCKGKKWNKSYKKVLTESIRSNENVVEIYERIEEMISS